ncbi:hypothetical protein ARALYDRAFT_920231 [Arabidopsis lyrata subsp. lyrata]|uniref:F-box domain-containing protein n=1 Tax=Arabidopsis lyrata subsp. lyrata TaxID=81972 RepID=D7MWJ6_ARALL|nr:hypothetical protein ARALYDRAFT_920231 [Arabidopsis lyrata subsp. lyrata]
MESFTEDLWGIILARLPLRSVTSSKLVCKQWKSTVESPYFRHLFLSHHQNSSRGSLRCAIWGLTRSLGSYLSSFLTKTFETHNEKVRVLAYTNVGLILIGLGSDLKNPTYYMANPISQQCVKIPPRPLRPLGQQEECFRPGLVTRIEKDVLLGYKVVLMDRTNIRTGVLSLVVYSSETGLWSFNTLQSHPQLHYMSCIDPITLNGNIYWIESDQCRVILFPNDGTGKKFPRNCTISQDFLIYMNMVYENRAYKLRVWRLKSGEWQLVSEIPSVTSLEYFPLGINPFHGDIMYMWSKMDRHFSSINLYKGQIGRHNNLERSSHGRTLRFAREWDPDEDRIYIPFISRFLLPRWLHPIPSSPS